MKARQQAVRRAGRAVVTWVACLAAVGCGGAPEPAPRPASEAPAAEEWSALVPYGAVPFEGVLTGGQPSPEQLEALRDAGFQTVINLRREDERGVAGEAERVAALGMEYVSIPVDGGAGLTRQNVEALDWALAGTERPLLLHCGSSNRVGALVALRAAQLEGAGSEEALELGRAAGLTRLEDVVRELLERGERPTSAEPGSG